MAKNVHPLKRYRKSHTPPLSQAELARALGLKGRSSICEIEKGTRTPSVRIALEIERWTGGAVTAASLNPLLKRAAQQAAA